MTLALEIVAILLFGSVAIAGLETGHSRWTAIFKPLTTALLFFVVGWPSSSFAKLIDAGIFFSLVGDVALLRDSNKAFLVGLGGFLVAHVCYIAGFAGVGTWSGAVSAAALAAVAVSLLLLRMVWAGTAGLRAPVIVYAAALTTMVISAVSTLGRGMPGALEGVLGAILFYVSDSSLAINRFYSPIPHVSFLTQGVYWLGQLGIALAARGGIG